VQRERNAFKEKMDKLRVINAKTSNRDYKILINPGLCAQVPEILEDTLRGFEKIYLITDITILSIYKDTINEFLEKCGKPYRIFTLKQGEEQKNIDNVKKIYEDMLDFNLHRNDIVIAFGGGVVGDIAAFAASTFHRGIKLLQFPTTLVAQVDSSIGGKTAVNINNVKNAAGTFYQPHLIIIDPLFLNTLPEREIINGMAEVIKYGAVFNKNILPDLKKVAVSFKSGSLLKSIVSDIRFYEIIYKCCRLKAMAVKKDEYDTGFRNLLNFGHTFGHALEKETGLDLLNHGQAVAYGMLMAADASIMLNIAKAGLKKKLTDIYMLLKIPEKLPLNVFCQSINKTGNNGNKQISRDLAAAGTVQSMSFDKKFSSKSNKFILLRDTGRPVFVYNPDRDILIEAIKNNITGE